MSTYHVPISLKAFTVAENKATPDQVRQSLMSMSEWMRANQEHYHALDYRRDLDKLLDDDVRISGSPASFGRRELSIQPSIPANYQPYNMSEMFRARIVSQLGSRMVPEAIERLVVQIGDDANVKNLTQEYAAVFPHQKKPSWDQSKRVIDQILQKGRLSSTPAPDGLLPFNATDTHYSKLTRDKRKVFFTLKLESLGPVTLEFVFPKSARFEGAVSRPTVRVDQKGEVWFDFTVKKEAPKAASSGAVVGVDLGRVETFVATVARGDEYSHPHFSSRKAAWLSKRISALSAHGQRLYTKEQLCLANGRVAKAEVLRTERLRVRSKVSRLKVERAHVVANQIVGLAQEAGGLIVLEDLAWVPNGGKWDQSRQQEVIMHRARVKGVPTRKRSAVNTSKTCSACGSLDHSFVGRVYVCKSCGKRLDRDVNASRNIARRGDPHLTFSKSVLTRVPSPVITGCVPHFPVSDPALCRKYKEIE